MRIRKESTAKYEEGKNIFEEGISRDEEGKKFFSFSKNDFAASKFFPSRKTLQEVKERRFSNAISFQAREKTNLFLLAIESARRSFPTAAASASTLVDATTSDAESNNHNGCYTRENKDASEVHTIRLATRNPTQAISQAIRH